MFRGVVHKNIEAPRCINGAMPEGSISVTFGHRLFYVAAKLLLQPRSVKAGMSS